MKNFLCTMVVATVVAAMAAGCSGSKSSASGEVSTDMTAGTLISRADLMGALWGEAADDAEKAATTDADCLAASTFIVRNAIGFEIRLNAEPSDTNATPAVIVSPINIEISDDAGVQRGETCAAGTLAYVVTASEEQPIDVTATDAAAATNPVDAVAAEAAPYAEGCDVIAHFEASGDPSCGDDADIASTEGSADDTAADDDAEATEDVDCASQPSVQTFTLVIDQVLCSETVNPMPVTK